jgi:hypothetical protein
MASQDRFGTGPLCMPGSFLGQFFPDRCWLGSPGTWSPAHSCCRVRIFQERTAPWCCRTAGWCWAGTCRQGIAVEHHRCKRTHCCSSRVSTRNYGCPRQQSCCIPSLESAPSLSCTLLGKLFLLGNHQSRRWCSSLVQNRTCWQGSRCTRAGQPDSGTCLPGMEYTQLAAADGHHLLNCLGMYQQQYQYQRRRICPWGTPCTQGTMEEAGSTLGHSCTSPLR